MVFTTEIEKAEISMIKFPPIFSILNQELTYLVYVTVIFIAKVFRIASRTFCIVIIYFIIGIFNESDFIFSSNKYVVISVTELQILFMYSI